MTREPTKRPLSAGLYIVATPIGNLGDITLRSVETLRACDLIACEDTRVTGKLLKHLGVDKPMRRYNDHSDDEARNRLLAEMQDRAVVLVSDAGTPLISDPGYRLVRAAREANIAVTSLPGACAAIAGLTISGLPSDRFFFAGFLPSKDLARQEALQEIAELRATTIFYETGPRLVKSLQACADILTGRIFAVARELTKLHEECRTGTAADLIQHYSDAPPKGEIVLLIGAAPDMAVGDQETDTLLVEALRHYKLSQAAAAVAKATGRDRQMLYARALELRGK
ncbi:MAG: 16S rRNA (cytidine(1402)-2'-O)-methyltransferase [Pontixanthobacter sp.]